MNLLRFIVTVLTFGWSPRTKDLLKKFKALKESVMAIFDELKAELVSINETTNEIAQDVDDLVAKIQAATGKVLTEAEAAEILTGLKATSEGLKTVASKWTPETQPTPATE